MILAIKVMSCEDKNRKGLILKQSLTRQITETQIFSDESEFIRRNILDRYMQENLRHCPIFTNSSLFYLL